MAQQVDWSDFGRPPSATELERIHQNADTDVKGSAIHHTLGIGSNQAARGDHTHDGVDSVKIDFTKYTSGTTAQRDTLYPNPDVNTANSKVLWFNTDFGWWESYYVPTGTGGLVANGLIAGTAAGWYPIADGPELTLEPNTTWAATAGQYIQGWNAVVRRRGTVAWLDHDGSGIRILKAGNYDLSWWTLQPTGSGTADYHTRLNNSTDSIVNWMSNIGGQPLSAIFQVIGGTYRQYVPAGDRLRVLCQSGSLAVHNVTGGTTRPSTRGEMKVKYIGPPLVSD